MSISSQIQPYSKSSSDFYKHFFQGFVENNVFGRQQVKQLKYLFKLTVIFNKILFCFQFKRNSKQSYRFIQSIYKRRTIYNKVNVQTVKDTKTCLMSFWHATATQYCCGSKAYLFTVSFSFNLFVLIPKS